MGAIDGEVLRPADAGEPAEAVVKQVEVTAEVKMCDERRRAVAPCLFTLAPTWCKPPSMVAND